MINWIYTGGSPSTSHYEFTSRSGKFYTKSVYEYHGVIITRYQSEEYCHRYHAGLNEGKRMKTWERI